MDKPLNKPDQRFDVLLKAMASGEAPSARKKTSGDQASSVAPDACSSGTQTRPDTSEDASR
jgi:hypothetical protein